MIKQVLKEKQNVVYQVLENALKNQRLAHAYMFVGSKGSNTKETAILLAQSLVCDNANPFGCEACDTCKRIADFNYADMIYLDGELKGISKEAIINLKNEFSKTNSEVKGKKIYIINKAENASEAALNSLLTFLEEPTSDAIAILLVENLENILDTIKSRCQIIKFKKINSDECFNLIKNDYDNLDAYLISHLVNNISEVKEVSESDTYQHALFIFQDFMDKYLSNDYLYRNALYLDAFPKKHQDNKEVFEYFLRMIEIMSKDSLIDSRIEDNWYNKSIDKIDNHQALHLINVANALRDANIKGANFNLLIDQFLYKLEDNDE